MVTSAVRDFEGPQRSVRTGTLEQITWVSGVIQRGGPWRAAFEISKNGSF